MKKLIKNKPYWIIGTITLILSVIALIWIFNSKSSHRPIKMVKKEKIWETKPLKIAKDFASIKLPAKVKSNQFAVISPRRTGIIQDLLVDIGDEVYKGQTIGSMLPEGVAGQGSAAINKASAQLRKARAELSQAEGVAVDAVLVAEKQLNEKNLQSDTQINLEKETERQLSEKKSEAVIIATQVWENTKKTLFGLAPDNLTRKIEGNFTNSSLEIDIQNRAKEIQRMTTAENWGSEDIIIDHLTHIGDFLNQAELLYKGAVETSGFKKEKITKNLGDIQKRQLSISKLKQSILMLEEKNQRFVSVQAERLAGAEKSREVLDLVQSQQNLSITKARENVEVALANYNAALVKSGHQSIKSPFSGKITARMVEVGQAVMVNMPLFYLEGAQTTRSQEALSEIHFSLPESWKNNLEIGDRITIKNIKGESFDGEIFRLSDQVNLKTNSILATAKAFQTTFEEIPLETKNTNEIEDVSETLDLEQEAENESEIPNTEVKKTTSLKEIITPINFEHGESVFVYVLAQNSGQFSLPSLSLKKRGNRYYIWKIEDEKPVQIQVQLMAEDGEFSQIFSRELAVEDAVISNPSVSLFKQQK